MGCTRYRERCKEEVWRVECYRLKERRRKVTGERERGRGKSKHGEENSRDSERGRARSGETAAVVVHDSPVVGPRKGTY